MQRLLPSFSQGTTLTSEYKHPPSKCTPRMDQRKRAGLGKRSVRSQRKLGGILPGFQQITTPPPLSTFSQHGLRIFHKPKIGEFRRILPCNEHNNIAVTPSYDYYASSCWFSRLPFKFSSGNLCVSGYEFLDNVHDYHCVRCSQPQPPY